MLCSSSGTFPCIKLSHIQFLFLELNSIWIDDIHWAFARRLSLGGSLVSLVGLDVDSHLSVLHLGRNESSRGVGRCLDF